MKIGRLTEPGSDDEIGTAMVGPIMQAGEWVEFVAQAIAEDNPAAQVHLRDEGSYVHIQVAGQCRVTRATLSRIVGRPVRIGDVEPHMAFFAGHIRTTSDDMSWRTGQGSARPVPIGATER